MNDFLKFVDDLRHSFPITVDIYYSKIMNWCICVSKKGCASDYPDSPHDGEDAILAKAQGVDIELVFAKAHVRLKEWLLEYEGGY